MKKVSFKWVGTIILFCVLFSGIFMRRSAELANIYSSMISIAISIFVVCLLLDDCYGMVIKDITDINMSLLFKYRTLSLLCIILFLLHNLIQNKLFFSLILALVVVLIRFRDTYAQGKQLVIGNKIPIALLAIISISLIL